MDALIRSRSVDHLVRSASRSHIIRGGKGAPGASAGQDCGFGPLSGAFSTGEVINAPKLAHAAVVNTLWLQTDSGVSSDQVLTVRQMRLGSVVGSATVTLHTGVHDLEQAISPLAFLPGDYPSLLMPSPADGQLVDLTLTLGSTP